MPLFIFALVCLVFGSWLLMPVVFIWALNMLFGLDIPYNIYTWFAGAVIYGVLTAKITLKGV